MFTPFPFLGPTRESKHEGLQNMESKKQLWLGLLHGTL